MSPHERRAGVGVRTPLTDVKCTAVACPMVSSHGLVILNFVGEACGACGSADNLLLLVLVKDLYRQVHQQKESSDRTTHRHPTRVKAQQALTTPRDPKLHKGRETRGASGTVDLGPHQDQQTHRTRTCLPPPILGHA